MNPAETMASEVAEVVLPSKGMFYGDALPEGKVRVRPLTTREEKLLLSSRAEVRNKLIHTIVSDCIIEEDRKKLPFADYLVGDVIYLFIFIRSLTYGPEYTFFPACRYCGKPMRVEVMMPHQLGIYIFPDDHKEPFETTLPKSGTSVGLRLLRIRDARAIDKYVKKQRGKDEQVEYAYRIARHLVSKDGLDIQDPESREVIDFVESMHALDSEHIRETVIDNDCGVDMQLDEICPECDRPNEIYFEMTPDFFRSQSAKVRRRRGTIG
jgi:hypothetical protein